jgi:hypothetical protein
VFSRTISEGLNVKRTVWIAMLVMIQCSVLANGQTPTLYDVSNVVVGSQRLGTLWFLASGKWSDAGDNSGSLSTEIHCYKRFGYCEVASVFHSPEANVSLEEYDVLRWDNRELIAVDSSDKCIVTTLRADFVTKRVSLSSTSKGVTNDPYCKELDKLPTVFLLGQDDAFKATKPKK